MLTVHFGNDTIKSEFYDRLKSSDLQEQYHNLAEFRNLTSSCRAVFDLMKKHPNHFPPFFESPGYYGTLSDTSKRTKPEQQLKDMLQWQSLLGTASWNHNTGSTPWNPDEIDQLYNELALDVDAVNELEDDKCQAIEALVKVCGEHDPFYVDNADGSSRCIDFEHLFKLAFPKIDVPPIIWIDLNNTDEPFSLSCDKAVSTCGEDKRTNFLRGKGKATAIA